MNRILNLIVAGYLVCGVVWAQGGTAQISGTVSDRSGAVLPGVEIKATQAETGAVRTGVSNETGSYVLPNLPIGPYRLEATLPGFRTFAQSGIVLQVNASVVINPSLEVGQVTETVEVQANATMVETRATGIGEVIDNARILELPLIGRQVTDLVVLAGAAVDTGITGNTGRSFPGVPQFSIAGGLDRGTSFSLDGASHNDFRSNFGLPMPFPDALQEFKVETSAVPAQYGFRSGGALNAVTKAGTNQFHGNAFWFVRNELFNASNFFAPIVDGEKVRDALKRNQFGGTFGGPIKQNKMFFFFGYQGTTTRQAPTGATSFVPTPAMIRGDFSVIASTACRATPINLPAPFVNNVAPQSALSPAAVAVAQRLPAAEDACGTTRWGSPVKRDEHQFIGKVDHQLNSNHSMFWRYMGFPYKHAQPSALVNNALATTTPGQDNLFQSGTFGDTITLGSNKVNAFRLGWNRQAIQRINPEYFDANDIGVRNAYVGVPKMINIAVSQWFTVGSRTSAPNRYDETSYQVADDLGYIAGNHQFGFGGMWLSAQSNSDSQTFTLGTWDFNGSGTTANFPIADFMLGRMNQLEQGGANWTYGRSRVLGLYAQDSWKAKSNLTISLGLRWEPYIAQRYIRDQFNYFDIDAFLRGERTSKYRNAPAGLFYPGDAQFPAGGNSSMPIKNQWNKWAPRVGFVWDPTANGKTVIRSAYGIFYETQAAEHWIAVGQGPPWAGKALVQSTSFDNPYGTFPGGNPFPFVANADAPYPQSGVFAFAFPDTTPPVVHQWNVGIQQQIATDWLVSASYIGNHVSHIYGATELNPGVFIPGNANASGLCTTTVRGQTGSVRVNPGAACSTAANLVSRRVMTLLDADGSRQATKYGSMEAWDDTGMRSYNGMLLSVNKRLTGTFSTTANYTWSHCIGHPTNNLLQATAGGQVFNDSNDKDRDRGNCGAQDIRHNMNATGIIRMPQFSSPWVRRLAGNWRFSGIFKARSGEHLQPVVSADRSLTGSNPGQQRADILSSTYYGNKCTTDLRAANPTCRWLNADAFGTPALGALGTAGPGILAGPGEWSLDAGLSRTFDLGESQRVEFRAEANNILNHTNLGNPSTTLGANFGRITGAGEPRIMQFGLKYIF